MAPWQIAGLALLVGLLTAPARAGSVLYETDLGTSSINKITSGGVVSPFVTGLGEPTGLAFDTAGNLYVGDVISQSIMKITPGGVVSTFVSGLNFPNGLAFDAAGNLYEADRGSGSIDKITPGGVVSTFATGLKDPIGPAFDKAGNLFVTNIDFDSIRVERTRIAGLKGHASRG